MESKQSQKKKDFLTNYAKNYRPHLLKEKSNSKYFSLIHESEKAA